MEPRTASLFRSFLTIRDWSHLILRGAGADRAGASGIASENTDGVRKSKSRLRRIVFTVCGSYPYFQAVTLCGLRRIRQLAPTRRLLHHCSASLAHYSVDWVNWHLRMYS